VTEPKQITLAVAAFLDSPEARALAAPRPAEVRKIAETFLAVCYDELGKQPRFLDGQDVQAALGRGMPARMKRKDPLAEHVPAVLAAYFDHLETTQVVSQAYEIRRGLEAGAPTFLAAVQAGELANTTRVRQDPFVHRAEKLGRNDPCSCGSGKKYKKCHGKNA